jgi:FkbM family methyltransferase
MTLYQFKERLRPLFWTCRRILKQELTLVDTAYGRGVSYSQFGEDAFLNALFHGKERGFYVDVGAYHPYLLSNTYLFYKRGWRGINIEPNPDHFLLFPSRRPRDININVAVSTCEGVVPFTCNGAYSGIDDHTHLYKRSDLAAKKVSVKAMPLAKILDGYMSKGTSIDFLSVDCEGHDVEVLASNNWTKYRPAVVLVEDHGNSKEHNPDMLLETVGYRFEYQLRLTKIFILKDRPVRPG